MRLDPFLLYDVSIRSEEQLTSMTGLLEFRILPKCPLLVSQLIIQYDKFNALQIIQVKHSKH